MGYNNAVTILKTIENESTDVPLFSGHRRGREQIDAMLEEGVSFPLVASSPDKRLADQYAGEGSQGSPSVVFEFPIGSQAGFYQANESIATGEYEVTAHKWSDDGKRIDIKLKQTKRSTVWRNMMSNIVIAKALGWQESLSEEDMLDFDPFSGPIDLEGELEEWEAAGRTVVTVGGFEADPDTIEPLTTKLSVSERARLALKRSLVVELANPCQHAPYPEGRSCSGVGGGPNKDVPVRVDTHRDHILNINVIEQTSSIPDDVKDFVKNGLDAMAQVHGLPSDMPGIRIRTIHDENEGTFGAYSYNKNDALIPGEINVDPLGDHRELTLAHEFGHYIDHKGQLTWDSDWGTSRTGDPHIKAVQDAIRKSPEFQALLDINHAPYDDVEKARTDYYLSAKETFARAYAQWIGERSRNTRMRSAVGRITSSKDNDALHGNSQWELDNFKSIGEAFDALFRFRGLLNE